MKKNLSWKLDLLALMLFGLFSANTLASLVVGSTRIIYNQGDKEVSVKISNPGKQPVLVQSWIDNGNTQLEPEKIKTPFIISPPLTRVDPDKGQTLRLSFIGAPLTAGRESVFWLNVLEIPPVSVQKDKNQLQVAFRTRIKLFYRPKGLQGDANSSVQNLILQKQGRALKLTNSTPYFISLSQIEVMQHGKKIAIPADMVSPNGSELIDDKALATLDSNEKVTVTYIDDFGAINKQELPVRN